MPYRGFIQEAAGPAQRQLSLGLCALVLLSVLVVVPRAAVQSEGGEEFVFLPQPDGRSFRTQRVETKSMVLSLV